MDRNRMNVLLADLGILFIAFLWGTTNVMMRDALTGITPFWFCGLRFTVACFTVMLFFGKKAFALSNRDKITSSLIGMVYICAFIAGAVALIYTTAGNQSFIISMAVVLVPIAVWILSKKFPGWHVIASMAMCSVGLAGLMLDGELSVNIGDLLSFLACVFVTIYILLVQKFVQKVDAYSLACWQSFGGMLLALAVAAIFEPLPRDLSLKVWIVILHTGTIGFALTLVIQAVAQQYTSATHVAILLSTAGVFGSVTGIIFLGEPMTFRIFTASALILGGVIMVEAVPAFNRTYRKAEAKNEQITR